MFHGLTCLVFVKPQNESSKILLLVLDSLKIKGSALPLIYSYIPLLTQNKL